MALFIKSSTAFILDKRINKMFFGELTQILPFFIQIRLNEIFLQIVR